MRQIAAFIALAILMAAATCAPSRAETGRKVRVTTGSYEVAGWEQNLVKGNRNLRHFNWSPVTSFVQGTKTVTVVKGPDMNEVRVTRPHKSVYVRPIHIPTVIPRQVATPVAVNLSSRDVSAKLSRSVEPTRKPEVSAKLAAGKSEERLQGELRAPKQPELAVYPDLYVADSDTGLCGMLTNKSVSGRIRTRGCRNF